MGTTLQRKKTTQRLDCSLLATCWTVGVMTTSTARGIGARRLRILEQELARPWRRREGDWGLRLGFLERRKGNR